jgi:hypothetical protein
VSDLALFNPHSKIDISKGRFFGSSGMKSISRTRPGPALATVQFVRQAHAISPHQ